MRNLAQLNALQLDAAQAAAAQAAAQFAPQHQQQQQQQHGRSFGALGGMSKVFARDAPPLPDCIVELSVRDIPLEAMDRQ
jgi:hypothetical protein